MSSATNVDDDRFQPGEMPSEDGPLGTYNGREPNQPDWFRKALTQPVRDHRVKVKGVEIAYRQWGDASKQGLLFCHGNGAHAQWWDWICPFFQDDYNVVAMSFSGMGDSGHRASYDIETYSEEQIAVCDAAGLFRHNSNPILIAHSFGALISLHTGWNNGEKFSGLVHIDSPINPVEEPRRKFPRSPRPNRVYDTLAQALARFRLAPPQPCDNHFLMDYIARTGLKKVTAADGATSDGWMWKFDPGIWRPFDMSEAPERMARALKCPIASVRASNSLVVAPERWAFMRGLFGPDVPMSVIDDSHHHIMLDQPMALIEALKPILETWS